MKLLWIISVGFGVTEQALSNFLHSSDTGEKITMKHYISYSRTSRKPMIKSGEKSYNILIQFGTRMKLVRLIKMCLMKPIGYSV
jgi:hypothetical protein